MSQASFQFLKTTVEADGLCRLVLSRPKVNAMSPAFLSELVAAFRSFEVDDKVKGVLICSDQGAFSAGLDLKVNKSLNELFWFAIYHNCVV